MKKLFCIACLCSTCTQTVFYGGQRWLDKNTGKNIYLLYEEHNLKSIPQTKQIVKQAEKSKSKVLIESRYKQMQQNPGRAVSVLPYLHKLCQDNKIPVQDVDIRGVLKGTYEDGETLVNKKQLMQALEKTTEAFTELKKTAKTSDFPKQIQEFFTENIKELKKNPFFDLTTKAVKKKEKAKKFMNNYLDLSKKKGAIDILQKHRELKKKKKLKELPRAILRHMVNNELLRLLDLKAVYEIFKALKKYPSVILAAGGKHCAYIAELFETLGNLELVKELGTTDSIGSTELIDIKKLFAK